MSGGILVVDFGSQTAHLIARRIKNLGVKTEIISPGLALKRAKQERPNGLIFSGGPASVYSKKSPTIDPRIFKLSIPILGICYGFQLAGHLLGGKVIPGRKEYGPAKLVLSREDTVFDITHGLPKKLTVWMSHGDEVVTLPKGFEVIGSTDNVPYAFVQNKKQKIYGLQFHPEVGHTQHGTIILENFIKICGLGISAPKIEISVIEQKIKKVVGNSFVIGAVSGGVDSTVAGMITAKALGNHFIPVYVDNGLMREGTGEHVQKIFNGVGIKPKIIKVEKEMLKRLKGVQNPEKKRKIIGKFYIEIFEKEMEKLVKVGKDVQFLLQGTIYSDVIESQGTEHAAKIKSHHNVGGLPKKMKLKLLEPLRNFYKDEVRAVGKMMGLPEEFVQKQVFPGPGYAVRIRGEVTKDRLKKEKQADKIILEELDKAGILPKVYMSFPIMTGALSTAVKGDGRFFGEVVAVRIIESVDVMTSNWSKLSYDVLQKISSRIVNEVPGISRVVYDITTKPPATMEWE